jgi:phage portal protein BeeE
MNLFQSLLQNLGISNRRALRYYFNSKPQLLGFKGAVYLDVDAPYDIYQTIPEVRLAVDKKANMFSNVEFKYRNLKTNEITDMPIELQNLLRNPNLMQSFNSWLFNYSTQLDCYGNQFIYAPKTARFKSVPDRLMNVSPRYIAPVFTGKYYNQNDINDIIKHYELRDNATTKLIETKDVLWSKMDDLDNPLIGVSPLKALKYPISNSKLAYDYLNSISGEKGAIGMLSPEGKDGFGATPLSPNMKLQVEKDLRKNYGVEEEQNKVLMPDMPIKWTPFSYPTKDLLLLEQIDMYFKRILEVLGLNPNLFINSTYENLAHGIKLTYNDTIIPRADAFCQNLTKFLKVQEGFEIVPSYEHIAILQDNEAENATTFATKVNSVNQLVQGGIITAEQARTILAIEV